MIRVEQHQHRLDDGLLDDVAAGLLGAGEQGVLELDLGPPHQVVDRADRGAGVTGADRAALPDRAGDVGGHPVGEPDGVTGDRAVDQRALGGVGGEGEPEQRLLLAGQGRHEGGELLLVEASADQRGVGDRLLLGDGGLGPAERGHRAAGVRQALLAGQLGQGVTVRDQVGEDHPVPQGGLGDRHLPAVEHLLPGRVERPQVVVDHLEPVPYGGRDLTEVGPVGPVGVDPLAGGPDPQVVVVRAQLRVGQVAGRRHPLLVQILRERRNVDGERGQRPDLGGVDRTLGSGDESDCCQRDDRRNRYDQNEGEFGTNARIPQPGQAALPFVSGAFAWLGQGRRSGAHDIASVVSSTRLTRRPAPGATDSAMRGTAAISSEKILFGKPQSDRNRSTSTLVTVFPG